jgi:hypothetical protein
MPGYIWGTKLVLWIRDMFYLNTGWITWIGPIMWFIIWVSGRCDLGENQLDVFLAVPLTVKNVTMARVVNRSDYDGAYLTIFVVASFMSDVHN